MARLVNINAHEQITHEMYEAAEKKRGNHIRKYLGMSAIGGPCDRALWFHFRQYTPRKIPGRVLLLFDLGNRIEDQVVEALKDAGYEVSGQQEHFSAHDGWFRGHCDGLIDGVTSKRHILEVKSANQGKFSKFKANGVEKTYPVYWAQTQCYMGFSGLSRALVVVMNKNTSEIYAERIYFNQAAFERLHARAHDIITANEPPRPGLPETDEYCRIYCDYGAHCRKPGQALQSHFTCGSCINCEFHGLSPYCANFGAEIPRDWWGESGCPAYLFRESGVPF